MREGGLIYLRMTPSTTTRGAPGAASLAAAPGGSAKAKTESRISRSSMGAFWILPSWRRRREVENRGSDCSTV